MFSKPKQPGPPTPSLQDRKERIPFPPGHEEYDSEEEEPSQSYFEGHLRERARLTQPDAKARREARQRSLAWGIPVGGPHTLASMVPDKALRFTQPGGNCATYCFIFASMRRRGFTPREAIAQLRSGALGAYAAASHKNVGAIWDGLPMSFLPSLVAMEMTAVENEVHRYLRTAPKNPVGDLDRTARHTIVYPELIGTYPEGWVQEKIFLGAKFRTDMTLLSNRVINVSRWPTTVLARRLQEALCNQLQATRTVAVPVPSPSAISMGKVSPQLRAIRRSEPLILVEMRYRKKSGPRTGQITEHDVLIDLYDEREIGIFDPNFGWLTMQTKVDTLNLEIMLHTIWNHYSGLNMGAKAFGYSRMCNMNKFPNYFILAMQVCTQEMT